MSNLTLVVEETTIKAARSRALQEGTSLSAKAREFLAVEGAPKPAAREATLDLMQLMEVVCARLCRTLPRFYEFERRCIPNCAFSTRIFECSCYVRPTEVYGVEGRVRSEHRRK